MKVSGKEIADKLLQKLKFEIQEKNLHPNLAIILAGPDPASRIYVENKMKRAKEIGIEAKLHEFSSDQQKSCMDTLEQLNNDSQVHGIIVQQPMYEGWNADEFVNKVDSKKDVDGFKEDSPFKPATALGVWDVLSEFAKLEGFSKTEEFLKGKKIAVLGRGRTAGKPTRELIMSKGFEVELIHSKTEYPDEIIKNSDIVISATGKKNIIHGGNIKEGSYIIGVGINKGESGVYGDLNEEEISQKAKYYCTRVGPLTIANLLRNVVQASKNIRL